MIATQARLLDFIRKSTQFTIPVYQRTYSWTEQECRQLWDDILRAGQNNDITAHFIGSVVYIQEDVYQVTSQTPVMVIDGQQRLTSVSILLEALARRVADWEPVDGFSARKLRNYYLLNPEEDGSRHFKLLLTQTDHDSLLALVQQKSAWPQPVSIRLQENFEFFQRQIEDLGDDLAPLCRGLSKLLIVDVALTRGQDNPQLIFESLNSTGRELTQADLIRNFVLMGLEPKHQTRLYEEYWRPMEKDFGQEGYDKQFDAFMRHYLTYRTGDIPNIREVYEAFKSYFRRPKIAAKGVDALLADVHQFARYFTAMALDKEPNRALAAAFHDLRELKANTAYPLLLELYEDYAAGSLSAVEFEQAVRLIESYVFRRAVLRIPTNSLNKTFATFGKALRKHRYLESMQAHLQTMPSYRRFPSDEEFQRELKAIDLYGLNRRSYFLRRLENHGRKEHVSVEDYTIEHIMPQNPNLSTAWQQDLGPNWKQVQKTWLHTLGNLTLTGYNAEYSDRPFAEKRDMKGGFAESPLRLNQGLGTVARWNEQAMKERADMLAHLATQVWTAPKLGKATLANYGPGTAPLKLPDYTIEDHPQLAPESPMRPLFEQFRKQVLALDPVVSEEFLKYYVAYKAETNFVDVVPQTKRLRLVLNMAFHELHDPRGIARDLTGVGRWGNGDVDIGLASEDELPYVMGLVRQSFERQMGNGSED